MRESESYKKLRPHLAELFAIDRVENAIGVGMPDVLLSAKNRTIYVELKAEIGSTLRGSQCTWCMRRIAKGCHSDMFVIAYRGYKWYVFFMEDVVNNVGKVTIDVEHGSYDRPDSVATFLNKWLTNPIEARYDFRR